MKPKVEPEQLSFSVGRRQGRPDLSTFALPAVSTPATQLDAEARCRVQILSAAGELLVDQVVEVSRVGFVKHKPKKGESRAWWERIHKLEVLEELEAP